MPEFGDLLIVMAVAFAAPFALGLAPWLRLPSVLLEIVAGIVLGPSVLGVVEVDEAIDVICYWPASRSSSRSCGARLCASPLADSRRRSSSRFWLGSG
jgi:hypothetical protein